MIEDITFHGKLQNDIEYFVTLAGYDVSRRSFFEHGGFEDGTLRFFANGQEFALTPEGVRYTGCGGSVAEYMFGTDQPVNDLVKKEVLNRLVMFGAYYDESGKNLVFSDRNEAQESYENIFLKGNAVSNYFFLLPEATQEDIRTRQAHILRLIGKFLKRTDFVGNEKDTQLAHEILNTLQDPEAVLFLFRIVNLKHFAYRKAYQELFENKETQDEQAQKYLESMADELGVDPYQQHRIRIDSIYKEKQNRKIIDTYKDLLIECAQEGVSNSHRTRLKRLRTLSVRLNIPPNLFDTLDELLLDESIFAADSSTEPAYIDQTREILEGLFLDEHAASSLSNEDVRKILEAKQIATDERNSTFEQILLDTGRICDERAAETGNIDLLENFGYILTYLDRYDSTSSNISRLAFMDDVTLGADKIRSLLGNTEEFDKLENGFFQSLFIKPITTNKYVSSYGRKKIMALDKGLRRIREDLASIPEVENEIKALAKEEKLYRLVHSSIKEYIRNFYYSDLRDKTSLNLLRKEISQELTRRQQIDEDIPESFFDKVVLDINKEAFYLQNLLPVILDAQDSKLREDFVLNSGLDRFYIEELENEFLEAAEGDETALNNVRENGSAS